MLKCNREGKMIKRATNKKTFAIFITAIVVLSVFVWMANNHKVSPVKTGNKPAVNTTATPLISVGPSATTSKTSLTPPAPTPTVSSVTVSNFAVSYLGNGKIKAPNVITGASAGSCILSLTSPSKKASSFTGSIIYGGTYYFCSFGAMAGISEKGGWSATLSASSTGTTRSSDTTFEVTN
jgi:hypothetical protein